MSCYIRECASSLILRQCTLALEGWRWRQWRRWARQRGFGGEQVGTGGGGGGGATRSVSVGPCWSHWFAVSPQQESDTPPPPRLRLILCLVNLRIKLLWLESCRFPCVPTVNIHNTRTVRLAQWYTLTPRPNRTLGVRTKRGRLWFVSNGGKKQMNYVKWRWSPELFISPPPKDIITLRLAV